MSVQATLEDDVSDDNDDDSGSAPFWLSPGPNSNTQGWLVRQALTDFSPTPRHNNRSKESFITYSTCMVIMIINKHCA